MSHAQILVGDSDTVRSHARVLAKGANCLQNMESKTPCGGCTSCKLFEAGNHPDTFYVTKTKQSIGVDDVREQIVAPMSTKPFAYSYKVFIVDKAETLTPAAQSALLKTIEEPAPYGLFLFLAAHSHNFLPTILSRCHLHKLSSDTSTAPNPELQALAQEIADSAHNLDILDAFQMYRRFEQYKESKETLQELLDLIYHAFGKKISDSARAKQQPKQEWLNATSAITHAKNVLSQNGNTQLAVELMLMDMTSASSRSPQA